jgi:GDPmannose 4,6-dehydratase
MWLMLQQDSPDDFVIATGKTTSLKDFIEITFDILGLNWEEYVDLDEDLIRPTDITVGLANPKKAKKFLNWEAKVGIEDIIKLMLVNEENT